MPRSKSKDAYGKVNAENISGRKVPRRSGFNETPFKKATRATPNLPQTGTKKVGPLTGSVARRSGRGGGGPTLRGGING